MSKPVFGRTARSQVWDHFVKSKDGKTAKCKLCERDYAYHGQTTSNLQNHLKNHHPSVVPGAKANVAEGKNKLMTDFAVSRPKKTCGSAQSECITQLLVNWVTTSMRPLSLVSDGGLRDLLEFLEPGYQLPSRTHIAAIVRNRHKSGLEEVRRLLADAAAVAITTDAWTSKSVRSFATYTAHFLDSGWHLTSLVLATRPMDVRHTAENVSQHAAAIAEEFGISGKVVGIVHDEAPNMVAAARILAEKDSKWSSLVCAAHRLQTCLKHAIDSSSPVQKLLAAARKLVTHFHHSAISTRHLLDKQIGHAESGDKQPLKVIQDVSTRWNSTFYMLKRLLDLKVPITSVLVDPKLTPNAGHRALLLKEKRWVLAEELVSVLEPYEKATSVLSGQQYVTASCILPILTSLLRSTEARRNEAEASGSATVRSFCDLLVGEIKGKFSCDPADETSLPAVAASLDPRSRSLSFLPADNRGDMKTELIRRCTLYLADHCERPDEETEKSADATCVEPPPKKKPSDYFDLFFGDADDEEVSQSVSLQQEVERYFSEGPAPAKTDVLEWWSVNHSRFPFLSQLTREVLCVPATSVPSERVFSAAGHIVNKLRASLSAENVDALIFLQQNRCLKVNLAVVPGSSWPAGGRCGCSHCNGCGFGRGTC